MGRRHLFGGNFAKVGEGFRVSWTQGEKGKGEKNPSFSFVITEIPLRC